MNLKTAKIVVLSTKIGTFGRDMNLKGSNEFGLVKVKFKMSLGQPV